MNMKTHIFLGLLFVGLWANAQIVYHDASQFALLGRATNSTQTRYERLPDSLQSKVRPVLWNLGQNTAGLAVRFRTNSTTVSAQWTVRFDNVMNHMALTGIKGLDLYCLEDTVWRFAGVGRPSGKENKATLVAHMESKMREFLLYLPLYDGITDLQIGVDSLSEILLPAINLPVREKPIVFYGTSILQGGCATRPGMAHTNILSRWLNRETINLGFSGNGLLDVEIAEIMAHIDASVYVLDFVPNCQAARIDSLAERFYKVIRERQPYTPILFVENPVYPYSFYNKQVADDIASRNESINRIFHLLKEKGDKNIWLLKSENMIGHDGEATVDGEHFTDLGFMRYAEFLYPILQKHMGQ